MALIFYVCSPITSGNFCYQLPFSILMEVLIGCQSWKERGEGGQNTELQISVSWLFLRKKKCKERGEGEADNAGGRWISPLSKAFYIFKDASKKEEKNQASKGCNALSSLFLEANQSSLCTHMGPVRTRWAFARHYAMLFSPSGGSSTCSQRWLSEFLYNGF